MTNKIIILFIALIPAILIKTAFANSIVTSQTIEPGIYDGKIGSDKLIFVIQESNEEKASGYYIHNGNNAIEDDHQIEIGVKANKFMITSDEFEGVFKGEITKDAVKGKLKMTSDKSFFFFWKNNRKINLKKRDEQIQPSPDRYQKKIFDTIDVYSDLVYGKALGYWTESPYLDEPYLELLAKGTVNLFKGEKELNLKLDLYHPANDKLQLRPLILLIHGGGFYIGNKQSFTEIALANEFAARGYVVASMNYRMGFKMTTSDVERIGYKALQDVHAALRFLSHHADAYGIDPSQVYVAGNSAGAIASLNIAFMKNNERPKSSFKYKNKADLGNIESSGNKLKNRFEVKAVGNLWGAVTDTTIIDEDEIIPVISFHGNADDIVPYNYDYPFQNTLFINRMFMDKMYGSEPIHQRLNHLGIDNRFITFEGLGHEPHLDNSEKLNTTYNVILDEMIQFFYLQTASKILLDHDLIVIKKTDKVAPLHLMIKNGALSYTQVNGGLKISPKTDESKIIWINNGHPNPTVIVYAKNKFDAWSTKKLEVILID